MEIATYKDVLLTLAQIAITLIGFSGIVVIFGKRSEAQWTPEESLQLYALIAPSFIVLVGAFIPILISTVIENPSLIWRISNGITGFIMSLNFAYFMSNPNRAKMTIGHKISAFLGIFVLLSYFLAALAVLPWYVFIYIFGLIWSVFIGIHNFVLLFGWRIKLRT